MSWRDDASQEAQNDLDTLLGHGLDFAQTMLEKRGEFLPFAAAVNKDGETQMMAATGDLESLEDQGSSVEILAQLLAGIVSDKYGLRAAVIISDVWINGADAIRLELEHREGQAMNVFLPYSPTTSDAALVVYGELSAMPSNRQIWDA